MAQLNYQADPSMPTNTYDVLPKGKYLCMAIASEMKKTKNMTGEYLQITFEVIDGSGKGRKIFDRLNIRNQNKTAEKIAMESLNALCMATNVLHLTDSEQLHNIPLVLDVTIEDGRDGYEAQNRVKSYSAASGGVSAPAAAPAPMQPAVNAPAAGGGTPVWKKKAAA